MYEDFYNMAMLPFENTPDSRFYFASEQHQEALAAIEYTIRMRKGFVLITGDVGTGKTTVGQIMRNRCEGQATIVEITYGHHSRDALLRQILRTLNITNVPQDDHSILIDKLRDYLLEQLRFNKPVVLFVDEAQTLSNETLEELRLMSNLDTTQQKAVQIVLVGQPELRQRLREPGHAALRQRIVMAKKIDPLNRQETGTYINHRIAAASVDPQQPKATFNLDAIDAIYQHSNGIPRLINVACDNCLLMAYVREENQISSSIVYKVMAEMIPTLDDGSDRGTSVPPSLALAGGF